MAGTNLVSNQRLQELIKAARERAAASSNQAATPASNASLFDNNADVAASNASNASNAEAVHAIMQQQLPEIPQASNTASQGFSWNAEQLQAIELIEAGRSCCIVGSAGTGKTTLNKESIRRLVQSSRMPILQAADATKVLNAGEPGIVCVSFTRSAVANIAKALNRAVTCSTIHALLEFEPVTYAEWDDEQQRDVSKRIFEPQRNRNNPLPANLRTIIVEESGIVNIRLFNQLLDALPNAEEVQFIFLGDLFQLDPPYDPAILGYALDCLLVVELTRVCRQALESPILSFAIDIKEGKQWGRQHFDSLCKQTDHGKLTVKPWKHKIDSFKATNEAAKFIKKEYEAGNWHPDNSCIITPFGAALNSKDKDAVFGSYNLNRLIADFLGRARGAVVHEVIAGFSKHYFAEGDDIIYEKTKGKITKIEKNKEYLGKQSPQAASLHLDRFGHNSNAAMDAIEAIHASEEDVEAEMDRLLAAASADNSEALRTASHVVTVVLENGCELELKSAGAFSPQKFDFSYAMTCYKAQGSEWDNVYVFTHKSHSVGLCNEFFYTACTRARKELTLICEGDHLMQACSKQSIPGRNWKEKMQHFTLAKKREALMPFSSLLRFLGFNKQQLQTLMN